MAFLFPELLWALFALAIPIIIHLFNFRRYRRVYFSSVRFLKEAKEETTSQSRLKHLLVLAARLLALLFLILAFAQPLIPNGNASVERGYHAVSIYIDNSFSMEGMSQNGTLLDEAKAKAKELVLGYGVNDRFQLVTNDFQGDQQRLLTPEEFNDRVTEIKVSPVFRSIREVARRQKDVLRNSGMPNLRAYWISDFQKGLVDEASEVSDTLIQQYLVPLKTESIANLAIDSAWFASPVHKVAGNEALVLRFKNTGAKDVANAPIKLVINGQQKAISSISMPKNSSRLDTINFTNATAGDQQGVVTVTDHPVTFDDSYYFTWNVASERNVLLITDTEVPFFQAVYGGDRYFKLTTVRAGGLDYAAFSQYQLIIVNGLKSISSGLSQELKRRVEAGGSVLVFPGEEVDLKSYDQFASMMQLPAYEAADNSRVGKLSAINLESGIFEGVFDKRPINMDLPEVKRYYPIKRFANTAAEELLQLEAGQAFFTVCPVGSGKVYQSAVPLAEDWSNFQKHAIFLPVLYRIALMSNHDLPLAYTIGKQEQLLLNSNTQTREEGLKLAGKDFEVIPDVRTSSSGSELFVGDQVKQAGFYTINSGKTQLGTVAFNFNRKESVLEYYSVSELEERCKNAKTNIIADAQRPLQTLVTAMNAGTSLWPWCLVLVLLFVLAEILLIRFGDRWLSPQN